MMHSHHYEPVVYQVDDDDDLLGEALSVPINIKLGSMGRGGERYNEISELHDQTRNLEVDLTWQEAIKKEFGIMIDSKRYFFRRTACNSSLHSVKSKISELLAEFKISPKGDWKITIIHKELYDSSVDVNGIKTESMTPPPYHNPRTIALPTRKHHNSDNNDTPILSVKNKSYKTMEKTGHDHNGYESTRRPAYAVTSNSRHALPPVQQQQIFRWEGTGNGGREALSQYSFEKDESVLPNYHTAGYRSPQPPTNGFAYDDDDAASMLSRDSQDSQDSQEDLDALGIEHEDLKTVFLQRIRENLTGEMILEAKTALENLKASQSRANGKRDRWTRWSIQCPYPVAVLRALFDV
ncbi:uncharacterized protein LOC110858184 [Folsomia candida]|uniref:uncharacterized protein LOC110858184 n=1 Tax=Folsomia candida TaxID=158441 RepID=UPI000B8F9048|nr:uncharacterized protein LOC110858184 [Folsomia candida]